MANQTDNSKNLELWNKVEKVPVEFLKEIGGGRLKGKTDISPMWRIWQLTELYGPCGDGWYYKLIDWKLIEAGGEASIQAHIELYVGGGLPITGVGGSKILKKEKDAYYHDDEALKCAVTDAISVACKQLGFASAIYEGRFDGSKYQERKGTPPPTPPPAVPLPAQKKKAPPKAEPAPVNADIKKVLEAFTAIDTPVEQLEEIVGKKEGDWGAAEIAKLRKYYATAKKKYDEFHKNT